VRMRHDVDGLTIASWSNASLVYVHAMFLKHAGITLFAVLFARKVFANSLTLSWLRVGDYFV